MRIAWQIHSSYILHSSLSKFSSLPCTETRTPVIKKLYNNFLLFFGQLLPRFSFFEIKNISKELNMK